MVLSEVINYKYEDLLLKLGGNCKPFPLYKQIIFSGELVDSQYTNSTVVAFFDLVTSEFLLLDERISVEDVDVDQVYEFVDKFNKNNPNYIADIDVTEDEKYIDLNIMKKSIYDVANS